MGSSPSKAISTSLPSQKGKIIAITGCTSGTGYHLAQQSLEKGASVIMLNRESSRLTSAIASLEKFVKAEEGAFLVSIPCNLMDFKSVRGAASELKEKYGDVGIDVLCNNAGIMAFPDKATVDGFDIQMQTNHLSHFLLTKELFPLLEKRAEDAGEARIVNHSSIARLGEPLDAKYLEKNGGNLGGYKDNGGLDENSPQFVRYHHTKLANCVFTYALVDKLATKGSKVKALVAHPGVATTSLINEDKPMNKEMGSFTKVMMKVVAPLILQGSEDGAVGIIKCSLLEGVQSGDFYGPGAKGYRGDAVLIPPEDYLKDSQSKSMLWEKSEAAIGEKFDL